MSTRVYLLDGGSLLMDKTFITWNHGHGTEVRFPVYSILIDHPEATILVDTGFDKEWVEEHLPFEKPQQSERQTLPAQLDLIGMTTDDVDIVVNSHLHMDHCGANRLFPDAKFVMTKTELRHAYVPDPWEVLGYDHTLVEIPSGGDFELLELNGYDYELVSGVTLIETPGHSEGHLSVTVELENEPAMIFPIDVAWTKENLEERHLMGLHSDPRELLDSMMRIENIAKKLDGRIFFPHDPDEYEGYKHAPEYYGG